MYLKSWIEKGASKVRSPELCQNFAFSLCLPFLLLLSRYLSLSLSCSRSLYTRHQHGRQISRNLCNFACAREYSWADLSKIREKTFVYKRRWKKSSKPKKYLKINMGLWKIGWFFSKICARLLKTFNAYKMLLKSFDWTMSVDLREDQFLTQFMNNITKKSRSQHWAGNFVDLGSANSSMQG